MNTVDIVDNFAVKIMSAVFLVLILVACHSKSDSTKIKDNPEFISLFNQSMNTDATCYRIPALIKTSNGDLIAAIDERNISCGDLRSNRDINIVIRRSSDNGDTWSNIEMIVDYPLGQSASDPSMIMDRKSGKVFLFYNYMDIEHNPNTYFLYYISSIDNGKSWSEPIDITSQISKPEWNKDFKFITSGRGIQTNTGTLLHTVVNLEKGLHVFGSADYGETWFLIDTPIIPGDESKIIELENNTWMINSRVNNSGLRYVHISSDNGRTWDTYADSTLVDPSCNASIIRYTSQQDGYGKSRLLFSNASSKHSREDLTLRLSYDEGQTWKYGKSIYKGKAAYSSLTILQNGDIGVFFEKDDYKDNVFTKITLDWLTDGEDSLRKKD